MTPARYAAIAATIALAGPAIIAVLIWRAAAQTDCNPEGWDDTDMIDPDGWDT